MKTFVLEIRDSSNKLVYHDRLVEDSTCSGICIHYTTHVLPKIRKLFPGLTIRITKIEELIA